MTELSPAAQKVKEALAAKNLETPSCRLAMENSQRKAKIEAHFREIMKLMELDLHDDSLSETPHRVAKMYVDEIFSGLNYHNFPKITLIENKMQVDEMIT
ncbi:MAG: GTP cyclohydrolase I, partial [Gilliamella apis]|nr:GTP cyclohydrolase I [Gilliamella apis]